MEENQKITKKENINAQFTNSQKLVLDFLKNYSYDDVMSYILDENNKIVNDDLQIKLKELIDKIEIDELAKLLTKNEINKLFLSQKTDDTSEQINISENEEKISEKCLKIKKNDEIKTTKIRNKRKRKKEKSEKSKIYLSKILYRKNDDDDSIYAYRYLTNKKGNIYLLRCQDKFCESKAYYNFENKEICIYEDHSKDIKEHIYLKSTSPDNIKSLISYMKQNKEILSLEILSDNSKHIINNFKENHNLKKKKEMSNKQSPNNTFNNILNKVKQFLTIKLFKEPNPPDIIFNTKNVIIKHKKPALFKIKNFKNKEKINDDKKQIIDEHNFDSFEISLDEEEFRSKNENEKEKEKFINEKENYCEVKDKYLKHKQLLTDIEQMCFGENKRLGTHFHKDIKGKIYNYFGNNKEIKDFNMNYRCLLKGCKSKAVYNLKSRTFTILTDHSKSYEEHYCSNPKDKKTKEWINYLKVNENISDLQIILI